MNNANYWFVIYYFLLTRNLTLSLSLSPIFKVLYFVFLLWQKCTYEEVLFSNSVLTIKCPMLSWFSLYFAFLFLGFWFYYYPRKIIIWVLEKEKKVLGLFIQPTWHYKKSFFRGLSHKHAHITSCQS